MNSVIDMIKKHKREIFLLISIVLTVFSILVMFRVRYVYSAVPLMVLFLLGVLNIDFHNKNSIVIDIFVIGLLYLEIVYFFQLITLVQVADYNELIYLAILTHDNLWLYLIPLVILFYFFFRILFGIRLSAVLTPIIFALLSLTSYYLSEFRGHGFTAADFNSADTAMNVIGGYKFDLVTPIAFIVVPYFLTLICVFNIEVKNKKVGAKERLIRACIFVVAFAINLSVVLLWKNNHAVEMWGYNVATYNGFYMNFEMSLLNAFVTAPDGYDKDKLNNFFREFQLSADSDSANIIVIMNESYMDATIYEDQSGPIVLPDSYWNSLNENTIHGYAMSSVYGGNTANSEFEMLTSLSLAFIPKGAIVYTQFLDSEIQTLPRLLEEIGYSSYVMHPYYSNGWNRTAVYPLMGFEHMLFIDDFKYSESDYIRSFISDECAYRNLLEQVDNNQNKGFYYLITMQNHGGYGDFSDNFDVKEYIPRSITGEGEYNTVNSYLSLINKSDEALEYLIDELSQREEKFVLLVFGDHQPYLNYYVHDFAPGGRSWIIPYIIWTNYDIPEETIDRLTHIEDPTSINYLALDLLDVAGIEYNSYYDLIALIREQIPCINQAGYRLAGSDEYYDISEDSDNEMLQIYDYLTYDVLFDKEDSLLTEID